jgi:hypothetical protein
LCAHYDCRIVVDGIIEINVISTSFIQIQYRRFVHTGIFNTSIIYTRIIQTGLVDCSILCSCIVNASFVNIKCSVFTCRIKPGF